MTDERALLRETVEAILARYCTPDRVEAAEGGWDDELWAALADSELTRLGIPVEDGGAGGDLADVAIVVEAAAAAAAPIPLGDTVVVAAWLRQVAGLPHRDGPATVAVLTPGDVRTDGDAVVIDGRAERVAWARVTDRVLLVAPADGGGVVADVAADDLQIAPGDNMAGEPSDGVIADRLRVPAADVRSVDGQAVDGLRDRGGLCRALMLAGAMARVQELTVAYARERVQFGRPIGKFQSVQHQLAELAGEVAVVAAAVHGAVAAAESGPATLPVAAARVRAAQAAAVVARISHQVHGAIGFTREHQLQQFTRRLWAWRDEHGTEAEWTRALGAMVAGAGAEGFWASITT